jgi:hypothetical protein
MRTFLFAALTAASLFLAAGVVEASDGPDDYFVGETSLASLFKVPTPGPTFGFLNVCQDVVTVEEYERLTGVHKRLGFGFFGGVQILEGGSAGHGYIVSENRTLKADFGDIWSAMGFGGGIDFSVMVMPIYTVNFGVGAAYHVGQTFDGNTWDDLVALPFYLGVRINLPLGVSMERWFDFQNPDIAAESHGMVPIPYIKAKAIGWFMKEIQIDGWAVEPGKKAVGGKEEYFRRGIYGGAYGGFGIEARFSALGFYAEAGFRYIWHPKLTLRFDEMLTSGDFFEITLEFGIVYYFGSGRIIKIS